MDARQRAETLPSGRQATFKNRNGWANDRLKRAGLSESLKRGFWRATDEGRRFAAKYEAGIPEDLIQQMAFRPAVERLGSDDDAEIPETELLATDASRTAEERLQSAYVEIRERVRQDLLEQTRLGTPDFFERLVLDLLQRMGYGGGPDALRQTGGSGDGGIDGVITLDRLGLEKVYVQAKRHAADNTIGRPIIQAFFGALAGRRATKGVFITTSGFSREAREFAATASDSIVLVNGRQLADLMIDHGVGVTARERYVLVDVDSDYFEEA